MADKKISELPAAESLESTDLMMIAQENVSSSSGYVSMKTTAADVADEFNTELTYSGLNTTNKTVVGAINEVKSTAEGMVEANPAGSAFTALNKIKIGNTTYEIENTGSIVSVFQTLGTGTEIGSVTVDNVETKFYAPTPTEVTANPQGTSSIDLEKISIGGSIYNIPSGGSQVGDLDDLSNVTITTPTDGQVLKYNDSTHEWVNAAESGGGSSTLTGLTDTSISSPAADQDLSYDSTSSKWVNKTHRVELTKAEYDALPSSKLTDGIEYFITDMETTGTEIVANPEDTATDTLTKLQIGDDVYNISGGSSGGHTILDNDGTALTQRDDLQFIGAYVNDDNTNEITKVNVVREMTKAQFDLLSNDEKVGLIRTTDENDGAYSSLNYSTTEQKTGQKWIDGKDIYQKTFSISSVTAPYTRVASLENVDKIIKYEGNAYVTDQDTVYTMSIPFNRVSTNYAYLVRTKTSQSDEFGISCGSDWNVGGAVQADVTIQYTKTT